MNEWQPIETAPLNTPVLVYAMELGKPGIFLAKADEYGWEVVGAAGYEWDNSFNDPTHWMHLPEPPK